jgi:hypothetical protein
MGYHRPLQLSVLERMHEAYLEGRPELRPESLPDALQWASTPTFPNGANSLLIGNTEQGYLAFDYLIDLPVSGSMPEPAWSVLVDCATASDARMIAERALQVGYRDHAIIGYRRSAEAGNMPAEAALADLGLPIRPAKESLGRALEYLRVIREEFGPESERSLAAEQSVITMTMHTERYDRALTLLEDMSPRSERLLGPEHRIVLAAKYSTGVCTYHVADEEEGIIMIDTAIRDAERVLGVRDSAVFSRKMETVTLLAQTGHPDRARERMAALKSDYSGLDPDHYISQALQQLSITW